MTRNLFSLLMALPLTFVVVGCDPDDDTPGDDDTDVTQVSMTLVVNATAPIQVDECRMSDGLEVTSSDSTTFTGTRTFEYYDTMLMEVLTDREHALFADREIWFGWDENGATAQVDDEDYALTPTEDTDGNLTVTINLEWDDTSWCYAPNDATYVDQVSGFEIEPETRIINGECVMDDAGPGGVEAVVHIDSYYVDFGNGAFIDGHVSEDVETIDVLAQGQDGTQADYHYVRQ